MNCPICGKPYESMKRNKFGGAEYHHAGDPLNVFCQQSSASYKAAEQSVQADGRVLCACIPPLADTNSMGKCEACGCARR